MFNPVPPAADQPEAAQHEPDHETMPGLTAWRPRGRWPALLRLSWLCRLLALVSAAACGIWAVFGLLAMTLPGADSAMGLLILIGAVFSAFVSYIVWMGLAELIMLVIALERTTRQTRDRLPRHAVDVPEAFRRVPFEDEIRRDS
jgi:hypothetical protein